MHHAQHIGMEAESVERIVAVAVFHVATHGMSHVCRMHTDLVLASCFQFKLSEGMVGGTLQHLEMCHGIFSAVIHRR